MQAEEFRRHFPIFEDGVHLCSCSEGALSDRVIEANETFMTSWRVHAAPWQYWMEEVDRARRGFAELIRANPEDIAVVSCASEGAFQAAGVQDYRQGRNTIVTTDLEFPSIAHVWLAQQSQGAAVRFVYHHDGLVDAEDYRVHIGERTALVSVPLVSYANGLRFPVREIAQIAHQSGARVLVDAYQGAGIIPIDVSTLGADFLIAGTLKYLLGAPGLAFLWVSPSIQAANAPVLTGWFARSQPFAFTPEVLDYAPSARRFQTGTPAIPAAFAGAAGLSLINQIDIAQADVHVQHLADLAQAELAAQGWLFFSPEERSRRGPQVALACDDAEAVAAFLAERRIFVSPRGRAVRVSLHYYNNETDINRLVGALAEYRHRSMPIDSPTTLG